MENNPDKIHKKFASLAGSEHIASLANIRKIAEICQEEKPKSVLEMGGGIGTLSYVILSNSEANVDIYEDNDFCLQQLEENLKPFQGRFNIISSYRMLPPKHSYDFMIIDGGQNEPFHPEWFFLRYLREVKTIYIEGIRRSQYAWTCRALRHSYTFRLTRVKEMTADGLLHKGGKLIRCKPSNNFFMKNWAYFYSRLTEDFFFDRLYKFILRAIGIK